MTRLTVLCLLLLTCGCDGVLGDLDDAGPLEDAGTRDAEVEDGGLDERDAGADVGADAGWPDDAGTDGGVVAEVPPDPADIFFVGNSFTFNGPVPALVRDLAIFAGHAPPHVEYRALGGRALEYHRADDGPDGAPARVAEGWDVVVLQELSTRPTDSIGPAEQFKDDATYFHDLARDARAGCRVVLYETWARRAGHSIYTFSFDDPADMQAQLRFHYFDAAERHIPAASIALSGFDVAVAPVGDAWERQLAGGEPPILHAADDYHANEVGQYLNALVLYGTIYGRRTRGLRGIDVDHATARLLQAAADGVLASTRDAPMIEAPIGIAPGDGIAADVGPLAVDGWAAILDPAPATVGPIDTLEGARSGVFVSSSRFSGTQTGGRADNALGWPGDVSRDSLWIGSFDGHVTALESRATVVVHGLPPGTYAVELFASRTGDDGGNGRLTRYRIGAATRDLEVADNVDRVARFDEVRPSALGEIEIEVGVSPDGGARFAYLGALVVTRTGG